MNLKKLVEGINIGDRILLKEYGPYLDYKKHNTEYATITKRLKHSSFDFEIQWDNGVLSNINDSNILQS